METTLSERLLDYLRMTLGTGVGFAAQPARLSGGFDTTIMAFHLREAPAAWQGELILRLMAHAHLADRVRREAATHDALTGSRFAAPRVLCAETDTAPLGRPFLIMRRLAGATLWAHAVAPGHRLARIARAPKVLAAAQAQLHSVPVEALRASARKLGVDPAIFTLEGEVHRLAMQVERAGLSGLTGGARWLESHRPQPAQPEVICHGDFHPLNVMMDDAGFSGVIDWSQAIVAEPAFDVAATRVIPRLPNLGEPRWPLWLARRVTVRSYTRAYSAARPLDTRNLAYFEAMRVLHALTVAGTTPPSPTDPWNPPHTLAMLYRHFEPISGIRVRI